MPPSIACIQLHSCQRLVMKHCLAGTRRELIFGQRRLLLRRSHIGPQHPAALHQRIGFELDLLAEAAFDRLRRHFDALAGMVVFPAVIGAAQPVLLVAAEPERDAAMRAEFVDQAVASLGVAEGEQPLGQELHPHRRAFVLRQVPRRAAPGSSSCGTCCPIGVPGPVCVSRSFCSFLSIAQAPRPMRRIDPSSPECISPFAHRKPGPDRRH